MSHERGHVESLHHDAMSHSTSPTNTEPEASAEVSTIEKIDALTTEAQLSTSHSSTNSTPSQAKTRRWIESFGTSGLRVSQSRHPKGQTDSQGDKIPSEPPKRLWRGSFSRAGPLSGLLSLLLSVLSLIASLGILLGSDKAPTKSWSTPPSTYLAVCTAVANLAIRYACIQGVVIAWWTRALRGSSFERLHWDWRSGTTLIGAITSGSRIGMLGLACIASTLVFADGPLLQRASTTSLVPLDTFVTLNVTMAPELPFAFGGHWMASDLGDDFQRINTAFNETIPTSNGSTPNNMFPSFQYNLGISTTINDAWFSRAPLLGTVKGCPGTCKARIRAPALSETSCKFHTVPVNYTNNRHNSAWSAARAPSLDEYAFMAGLSLIEEQGQPEGLDLVTGYTTAQHCEGTFYWSACTLLSAIGEYDVRIDNNVVTLESSEPTIIALANNTIVSHEHDPPNPYFTGYPSTLATVAYFGAITWNSFVALQSWNGSMTSIVYGSGSDMRYLINTTDSDSCPSYRDPRRDFIRDLNKLMVYSGMVAAAEKDNLKPMMILDADLGYETITTGSVLGEHTIFEAHLRWFAAAAAVVVGCILLIAPTYWGFWKIGRPVSFSPLEMAKVTSV